MITRTAVQQFIQRPKATAGCQPASELLSD